MATSFIADFEPFGFHVVDTVGGTVFPCIELSLRRARITVFTIGGIGAVGHITRSGLLRDLVQV